MRRLFAVLYGFAAYSMFVTVVLYIVLFVVDVLVPKALANSAAVATFARATLIYVLVFTLFALHVAGASSGLRADA